MVTGVCQGYRLLIFGQRGRALAALIGRGHRNHAGSHDGGADEAMDDVLRGDAL